MKLTGKSAQLFVKEVSSMDFFTAIAMRRSTRIFTPEQIKDEDLALILKAGQAAPVGHSDFAGVRITALQNPDILKAWDQHCTAASGNPNYHMFYQAPTLIFVAAKPKSDGQPVYVADVACIMENMHLAATALGLGSVYLWAMVNRVPVTEELLHTLQLPPEFKPVSVLAVGNPKLPVSTRTLAELKPDRIAATILK